MEFLSLIALGVSTTVVSLIVFRFRTGKPLSRNNTHRVMKELELLDDVESGDIDEIYDTFQADLDDMYC